MIQSPILLLQKKSFVVLLYFITVAYVFGIWVWSAETVTTSFNGDPHSKLSELIYGTAFKPYVQRALLPVITRTIHEIIPTESWEWAEQQLLAIPKVQKEMKRLGWEKDFLSEYLIALALSFIALFAFSFVVREFWMSFYDTSGEIRNLVPVVVLFTLPTLFSTGPHYIYDFPALLFFTLGFSLLLKRRWFWYYVVYVVGSFNKETMVFLAIPFLFVFWKKEKPHRPLLHFIAQIAIAAAVKVILANMFSGNQGSAMEFHLYANIHTLLLGYSWTFLLITSATLWLMLHNFTDKPESLRKCAIVIVPFAASLLLSGIVTELRAVYEIIPIVMFLILHAVFFSILKRPYRVRQIGQ